MNQDKLNIANPITIELNSPSRAQIVYSKTLSLISLGFYYISFSDSDMELLEDDTYSYVITQDEVELKIGYVRLTGNTFSPEFIFDYTLDFTLS